MGTRPRRLPFRASRLLAAGLLAATITAGCGSGSSTSAQATTAAAATTTRPAAASRPRTAAERRMADVVHAWSDRLNAGDYAGIARLFALPAVLIQGRYEYRLTTAHQVALWHSGLPCSGKVVSIAYRGHFATAVFKLGNRRGSKCDAPGSLAAASFGFVNGKIVSWAQVPVPGGTGPVA